MFQHQGIWLPDGEKHFPEWMTKSGEIVDGKGTYQIKKFRSAMCWVKDWRVAVDVGAHVGLWSMHLIQRFHRVEAFEPMREYRYCWLRNVVDSAPTHIARINEVALGAEWGHAVMAVPPLDGGIDSGGTHIGQFLPGEATGDAMHAEVRTLDSFELVDVDFIKIDCEGYEHHVLAGARETLLRCKPCVIVEQKPHKLGPNFGIKGTPAVDFLKALGAKERAVLSGDHIMSWDA